MTSDPSYGTTGFFSYLWTKRHPVYDASAEFTILTADDSTTVLTANDGVTTLMVGNPAILDTLIRWV